MKKTRLAMARVAATGNQSKAKVASDTLAWQIEHVCRVSVHREYIFHDVRKWRFDGAIVDLRIAFEIEGGLYSGVKARQQLDVAFAAGASLPAAVVRDALLSQGGRHNKAAGMEKDLEKYNEAAALGWVVIRVMPEWVINGRALAWMERAIRAARKS